MKCPTLPYGSPRERNPNVYLNDGAGRDTYISHNNGGNYSPDMRFIVFGQDRSTMKTQIDSGFKTDQYPPSRIQYFTDGSGRDSYIQDATKVEQSSARNFKGQLRQYPNYSSPLLKRILPPIMVARERNRYETQKLLLDRLTSPQNIIKLKPIKSISHANLNIII